MNDLLIALGLTAWKPALTALLLPPVPFMAMAALGGVWLVKSERRRRGAWTLAIALAGLMASGSITVGEWMERVLLAPPPALGAADLDRVKHDADGGRRMAVLVLGGGLEPSAPEYGGAGNLPPYALERLRYGAWLARRLEVSLAYAGGVGHAQQAGTATEADIARRIAEQEFGVAIRWHESVSRDTRGNASNAVRVLREAGATEVLLVTHSWHMPRAMRAFTEAAGVGGGSPALRITPAPMGLAPSALKPLLRALPSDDGLLLVRRVWREQLGLWLGA